MIRRYIPTRRFTMWGFIALATLLAAVWIVSLFQVVFRFTPPLKESGISHPGLVANLYHGTLNVCYSEVPIIVDARILSDYEVSLPSSALEWSNVGGRFFFHRGSVPTNVQDKYTEVGIPLPWFVLASAAAALVARRGCRFNLKFLLVVVTAASLLLAWYGYWQPLLAQN